MRKLLLFTFLFLSSLAFGQNYNTNIGGWNISSGPVVPNACPIDGAKFFKNVSVEGWYTCISGTYAVDNVVATSAVDNFIAKFSGGNLINSACSENGITFSCPENVTYLRIHGNNFYCDQFAGATVDVKVNLCALSSQVNGGGLADASGITGDQTIAAEIDIGSYKAPTATAVSGAGFAAGTYKVATTLTPALTLPSGVAVLSQESTVTTSGANLSIQVASPPSGIIGATTFDVYITSGNPVSITNTALTTNVATYTATNNYTVGQLVTVSGTTNGAGTFNIVNQAVASVIGGGCPSACSSFTVAITHADVTTAADTGTATVAAGKWLEKKCSGGPYPIGTPVTISAVCSGGTQIVTKFVPVALIPPILGTWTGNYTDTTNCLIKFFHLSSVRGLNPGIGGPLEISNGASGNVRAVGCTDPNPPGNTGACSSVRVEGLQLGNRNGGTTGNAALDITGTCDTTTFDHLSVANYTPSQKGLWVHGGLAGVCCGLSISNSTFNNGSAGGVPVYVGNTSEGTSAVNFFNITAVHPGSGQPAVVVFNPSWTTSVSFNGLYLESYLPGGAAGACGGNDVSLIQLQNGGGSNSGGYTFINTKLGSACSGSAATSNIFQIDQNVKAVMIVNVNTGGWGHAIIDNNVSPARTIGNGVANNSIIPFYQTGNNGMFQASSGGLYDVGAGRTASSGTLTLCPTTACGAGDYLVAVELEQVNLCTTSTATQGVTNTTLGWTDDSAGGGVHADNMPLTGKFVNLNGATVQAWVNGAAGSSIFPFCGTGGACTVLPNVANGEQLIHSNGTQPITIATTVVACTTPGTGSYYIKANVQQVN